MGRLLAAIARLGAESELERVVRILVQEAVTLLDAEIGAYAVAAGGCIVTRATFERGEWVEHGVEVPLVGSIVGKVWQSGQSYFTNDSLGDPASAHAWDLEHGCRSQLTVALSGPEGERFGLATVFNSRRPQGFGARDERLLETLCQYAGAIVRRAIDAEARHTAEREATQRARELEAFAVIGAEISSSLDSGRVLQTAVEAARQVIGVDRAYLALCEHDGGVRVAARAGPGAESGRQLRVAAGRGISGLILATGRPYQTANYLSDPLIRRDAAADRLVRDMDTRSLLAVPITRAGASIGVLWLASSSARRFTPEEVSLLERIAGQAALAIENARALAHEQEARLEAETLLAATVALSVQADPAEVIHTLME